MTSRLLALALIACLSWRPARAAEIPVVISPNAAPAERSAAEELAGCLGRIFPQERFTSAQQLPASGQAILVGSVPREPRLKTLLATLPSEPESYVVGVAKGRQVGVIAGADAGGVVYGVYALLEKLGCGFYLSYDAIAPSRRETFAFEGWQLANKPLVRDRLVFNWHNFLSGCSTWNLPEWNAWTLQSQKQGYNAIMVHAYGNNPMVSFTFNGKTKPVGYLTTTVKGRDWSTMHVNDVRRLWGGQVFSEPVFGAQAAQVPDNHRVAATQQLMQQVFAYAQQRAMEVYFATDVDTGSANPQDLILTLPEDSRFAIQTKAGGMTGLAGQGNCKFWLANPDTPEGYRFYQAQVAALMKAYPQITTLVVWFRQGHTPWMELKVAEMPARWQDQWQAEIARTPEAEKLWHAPQVFALAKIVHAFDRALKELGHNHVQLAAGTWDFKFLAPCHRFFPAHVKLIGLDYNVLHDQPQLADAESRSVIREVGAHRQVIPIIWAQHDDGNYIGRSYTPFSDFNSRLADAHACGFGVIHWTTRPLDLFFKSHAEQVWATTKDRPLSDTCRDMAARSFGTDTCTTAGRYLEAWVTNAPKFARETSDFFIDRPLTEVARVVAGCRERLETLSHVDAAKLSPDQRSRLDYFRELESFIADFFQTHDTFQRSRDLLKGGDLAGARRAMADCDPENVIEKFARLSSLGGITRGEQGLVVSMNTRWLTHILRHRQALGIEAVRIKFAPTQHDLLAQSRGMFTFHFTPEHQVWQCLGEEETGASVFATPDVQDEICRTGIESDRPLQLVLQPIMARDSRGKTKPVPLPAGQYRLRLIMLDPISTAAGQRVFSVSANGATVEDRLDLFASTGGSRRVLERNWPVKLDRPGCVTVTLTPIRGKAMICGAVLEPGVARY
jgi:hypothetical protein